MRTFVGHRNRNTRKQFRLTDMRLIFGRLLVTEPNQNRYSRAGCRSLKFAEIPGTFGNADIPAGKRIRFTVFLGCRSVERTASNFSHSSIAT